MTIQFKIQNQKTHLMKLFDEFAKCLKAIDKLSTEEKKMIEAILSKYNSNINESL